MPIKPSADEIMSLLKPFGACPEHHCANGDHHCQSYVGPMFGSRERLLIVGLDHGKPGKEGSPCLSLARRREQILSYQNADKYNLADRNWNSHYRGCVKVASLIFGMDCETKCDKRCSLNPDPNQCVLTHFVQANVVKSVPRTAENMKFIQTHKITPSMPELLEEILVIKPSIVVLQGVKIRHPFFEAVKLSGRHECSTVGPQLPLHVVKWNRNGGADESFTSHIASLHHPSRGHLEKQLADVIVPTVRLIRKRLDPSANA